MFFRKFPLDILLIFSTVKNALQYHLIRSSSAKHADSNQIASQFVIDFELSLFICQHSPYNEDIHIHNISVLCDGFSDCYRHQNLHDEMFPLCNGGCKNPCGSSGTCLNDGLQAQCYCNAGFYGDACQIKDENECLLNPCSSFGYCTNTLGSFYCSCFPGYQEDGLHCSDINECDNNSTDAELSELCPENAECINTPGSYYCNCIDGYLPDSDSILTQCEDIDECFLGLDECADFGIGLLCQNKLGSYKCTSHCGQGFTQSDFKTCIDINECEIWPEICGPRAICANTPGSFTCTCETGFTGDGQTCDPIDDCSVNLNTCDPNAFCLVSLQMCFCQKGYVGDGITCFDINECRDINQSKLCTKYGDRCVNVPGTYLCCDSSFNDVQCRNENGFSCGKDCIPEFEESEVNPESDSKSTVINSELPIYLDKDVQTAYGVIIQRRKFKEFLK